MYKYSSGFPRHAYTYTKTYDNANTNYNTFKGRYYKGDGIWNKYGIWIMISGAILLIIMLWAIRYYFKEHFKPTPFTHYFNRHTFASQRDGYKPGGESRGESYARKLALKIFGKPFDKIRPEFLKNNVTGHNLELDLYNPEMKLGIEVSGKQHYVYTPFFHKNQEAFTNQKYRDEIKRMLCKNNGIKLIEVPYTVKLEDMETFLRIEARKLGYDT